MINKKLILILILIAIIAVSSYVTLCVNFKFNHDKDLEPIKSILVRYELIADRTYIDMKKSLEANALNNEKEIIIGKYFIEVDDLFTAKMENSIKYAWIARQAEAVMDGPETIDCGISSIKIKGFSSKNNKAKVNAILTKYLVDRVNKNGKIYLDRMRGNVIENLNLVKVNGKWKVDGGESTPDLDSTTHSQTEVK